MTSAADYHDDDHSEFSDDVRDYVVTMSSQALDVYLSLTNENEAAALDSAIALVGAFPHIGHVYDPIYEAARPKFTLYVTYSGRFGIYYEIFDKDHTVHIDFIEDQRRNPKRRFKE
jgi:plasmid stabilization system protein ParE